MKACPRASRASAGDRRRLQSPLFRSTQQQLTVAFAGRNGRKNRSGDVARNPMPKTFMAMSRRDRCSTRGPISGRQAARNFMRGPTRR
jgi:hypothetical protein